MTTPIVPTVTDDLIAELESAANAATPGRWCTDGDTWICAKDSDQLNNGFVLAICQGPDENKNAAYMAKASASVILALLAERASLKQQLAAASVDAERLNSIEANCWDVRYSSQPNADAGDSNISIEIVGHFMGQPFERVVGENYNENLRAAIDQAMTADAYPPARPEYDEADDTPAD